MASMSQSWNSILKFANTKFRSCLRPIAFHKSLQSLALLNLVLIQLKAEEGPQAFLDADEYHQAQAKCAQRSLGPHSAPQPSAAHTQTRACCCSGTSMDEEPLLEEKGNSMNDCFW